MQYVLFLLHTGKQIAVCYVNTFTRRSINSRPIFKRENMRKNIFKKMMRYILLI